MVGAADGVELAHGSAPTPWTPVPTGAELAPERLLEAAVAATAAALEHAPGGPVAGVGVTSMAETGVLLDGHGRPVAPAIAWHDGRGAAEAARLGADLGAERFSARTGLPVRPLWSIAKYAWLRANHPEVAGAVRWLGVAEWVVHGLGGEQVAELSLASRTGLLDLERRAWWDEARTWAGAPPGLLADLVQAGSPAGRVAGGRLGRLTGATLTVAGHDHLGASVGAGATRPGDLFDSCGTAEALIRAVQPPVAPEDVSRLVAANVTVGWHVLPGRNALLGILEGRARPPAVPRPARGRRRPGTRRARPGRGGRPAGQRGPGRAGRVRRPLRARGDRRRPQPRAGVAGGPGGGGRTGGRAAGPHRVGRRAEPAAGPGRRVGPQPGGPFGEAGRARRPTTGPRSPRPAPAGRRCWPASPPAASPGSTTCPTPARSPPIRRSRRPSLEPERSPR